MQDYWILLVAAFGVLSFVMAKASVLAWKQRGYVLKWRGWRSVLESACLALLALFSAFLSVAAGIAAVGAATWGVEKLIKN